MEVEEDAYAEIADLYDLEHAGFDEDLNLYLNIALAVGDPILELGCGSGRVVVPLAEAGHRVTGIDRSAAMLERAREAVAGAGVAERVQLARGEMATAAAPGGPFGVVILALNGLMHAASSEEQRATLDACRRALDPRGQLVLDLLHPTPEALRGMDGTVGHEGHWRLGDGTRVDKFGARQVAPSRQVIETTLWYDLIPPDGPPRRVATGFPLRYVQRAELELLLELAGFAEWRVYGGYELEPLEDGSERMIVLAEVTAAGRGGDTDFG